MVDSIPGRRVAALSKLLADIAWWVMIAAAAILFALILAWPLLPRDTFEWTTDIDVSISAEAAELFLETASASAESSSPPSALEVSQLQEVEGALELRALEWWPAVLGGLFALPAVAAVLYGLHLLRALLRDVLAARVFTSANALRLNRLGWLLILAGIALPLLEFAYALILRHEADLSALPVGVGIDGFSGVVPGLLVLVVASVWRYGVELQHDHDLTV